jgi:hypothetical protein
MYFYYILDMFASAPKEVSSLYNPINFQSSISGEDPITSSEAKNLFAAKNSSNVFTNIQSFNNPVALNSGLLVDGTSISNSTLLLKLNTEQVITQNPALSGTNALVASTFSGTLTANGNSVSKDVACDNLTIRAGKTIIQPTVSTAWNSLQRTRITDLEISGTLKLPAGATVEGITTYSDDLVLTGNSVIVQTNSATETNSLGNTNFNGTLVNVASSINQTNASATSALKNLTVVGACVLPTITSPSIDSLNSSITTLTTSLAGKANINGSMELQSNLSTSTNYFMDWHARNSTVDFDCRLQVQDAQIANSTTNGTSALQFTGSNFNCNSSLSVSGNISGTTITAITARLAALEGNRPSTAGFLLTWGNSSTQRRQSYPIVSSSAFYAPLVSSNCVIANAGFNLILYEGDAYTGSITYLDNTNGTQPLTLNNIAHRTYRAIEVFYKGVSINLPNAPL